MSRFQMSPATSNHALRRVAAFLAATLPSQVFADFKVGNELPTRVDLWNDKIALIVLSSFLIITFIMFLWLLQWALRKAQERKLVDHPASRTKAAGAQWQSRSLSGTRVRQKHHDTGRSQ